MTTTTAAHVPRAPPPSFHSLEALLTPLTKEAVGSLFSALDVNGDGRLSVEDFASPVTHEVSQAALAQWRRVHADAKGAAAAAYAGSLPSPAPASSSAGSVELWELERYFLRAAEAHAHASPAIQAALNGHVHRVGRDIANMLNLRVGVDAQKKRSRRSARLTTAATAAAAATTATVVAAAAASSAAVHAAASAAAGVGEHMHALVQLDGDSRRAVARLFAQLDKTGDGVIALDDFADEEGVSAEMHALFGELRALFGAVAAGGGRGATAAASIRLPEFLRFFLRQGVLFLQSDPDCALAVNGAVQDAVAAFYEATARPLDVEPAARSVAADVEDVRGGFGNLRVASAVGSEVSALDSFEYAVDDALDDGGGGEGRAQGQ